MPTRKRRRASSTRKSNDLIEAAEARARRILAERRDVLDVLSARLLEKEVVEGEELRQLLAAGDEARANDAIAQSTDRVIS